MITLFWVLIYLMLLEQFVVDVLQFDNNIFLHLSFPHFEF